ncbi:hypothetical protein MAHJHV61_33370 [Mycobacterium avium subsp. hominissuis]
MPIGAISMTGDMIRVPDMTIITMNASIMPPMRNGTIRISIGPRACSGSGSGGGTSTLSALICGIFRGAGVKVIVAICLISPCVAVCFVPERRGGVAPISVSRACYLPTATGA